MDNDQLKQRIIALLNLSRNNSNKNESLIAKKKAKQLMRRAGLTMKDLKPPVERPALNGHSVEDLINIIRIRNDIERLTKIEEEFIRKMKFGVARDILLAVFIVAIVLVLTMTLRKGC